jgi:hypothetical protein
VNAGSPEELSLDPPPELGDRFSVGSPGMLILRLMAGVVFLPVTFLRLVRGFLPGIGLAVCRGPWAVGVR